MHSWADGGPTDIDNLALLCGKHHRRIQDWSLQLHDGRIWATYTNDPTQTPRVNSIHQSLRAGTTPPPSGWKPPRPARSDPGHDPECEPEPGPQPADPDG